MHHEKMSPHFFFFKVFHLVLWCKARVYANNGKFSTDMFMLIKKKIRNVLTEEKLDDFGS